MAFLAIAAVTQPTSRGLQEFFWGILFAVATSLFTILYQKAGNRGEPLQWIGRLGMGAVGGVMGYALGVWLGPFDPTIMWAFSCAGGIAGPVLEPAVFGWVRSKSGVDLTKEADKHD